jgi:2-methylisocitrate lyase-like PEP mutase family enzyme
MTAAQVFASLHHRPEPFLLPNAWDVASAVLLDRAGFPAVGTTSLGITAGAGLPDGAGAGRELTLALAAALVPRLTVPLTVDLEGGYSDDPAEVAALAAHLHGLGVAGINLEDGRADRGLRARSQHAAVLSAVVDAAPGLFVNARTDTWWLEIGAEQTRLDETIDRLAAYRDAGASGVLVPGLADPHAARRIVDVIGLPLNLLWGPGTDVPALGAAGVARFSTGSTLYRTALGAALRTAEAARAGEQPTGQAITYQAVQALLVGKVDG